MTQRQVGLLQQPLPIPGVFRLDQGLQQVVQVPLDPLAQHKPVVAGELARMVAGPEDQVIRLSDHDDFLLSFHGLLPEKMLYFHG
jgi:hypothetical protein